MSNNSSAKEELSTTDRSFFATFSSYASAISKRSLRRNHSSDSKPQQPVSPFSYLVSFHRHGNPHAGTRVHRTFERVGLLLGMA